MDIQKNISYKIKITYGISNHRRNNTFFKRLFVILNFG